MTNAPVISFVMFGLAVVAGICCWVPASQTGRRAKLLTAVMVITCAPGVPSAGRLIVGAALLVTAMMSAVGARRTSQPTLVAHRALGAVLMSAVVLVMPDHATHSTSVGDQGARHLHGGSDLVPMLIIATAAFMIWSISMAIRPVMNTPAEGHYRPQMLLRGSEILAMGLATAVMLAGALLN